MLKVQDVTLGRYKEIGGASSVTNVLIIISAFRILHKTCERTTEEEVNRFGSICMQKAR